MNSQEARQLGLTIRNLVGEGQLTRAYKLLDPTLKGKTPFRLLDEIGQAVGPGPTDGVSIFAEQVAAHRTMGGWVVIGSALRQQLDLDLPGALRRCREYVVIADAWYATDILGERVPGPALVDDFADALPLLEPWRADESRWVRRTVGVAGHYWAKRAHGARDMERQAQQLLAFLEPMFEERDIDAIKGIGWGLKTLGKHYPDLVSEWLVHQLRQRGRNPRALMLRKATTYLSAAQRARATREIP